MFDRYTHRTNYCYLNAFSSAWTKSSRIQYRTNNSSEQFCNRRRLCVKEHSFMCCVS